MRGYLDYICCVANLGYGVEPSPVVGLSSSVTKEISEHISIHHLKLEKRVIRNYACIL